MTGLILVFVVLSYKHFRKPSEADKNPRLDSKSALIALSDGNQIPIDNSRYGIIITGSQVIYNDGALISSYQSRNDFLTKTRYCFSPSARDYMIVRSPAKRMFHVTLPDNSKIWLAANSSLMIPSDFNIDGNRMIKLSGEAYFDVSGLTTPSPGGRKKVPFIVLSDRQKTEVYGTRFNLSAYPNRPVVSTALYNGKLEITPLKGNHPAPFLPVPYNFDATAVVTGKPVTLLPNQVASLSSGNIEIEDNEGRESLEWNDNEAIFRNTPIEKILTIVAAWYNLEIIYKTKGKEKTLIGGAVDRNEELKYVLQTLSLTANIKLKLNGNRITVYE